MIQMNGFAQRMYEAGVCDERGAAFYATAVKLPDGQFGMVLLGVMGNQLFLYDADIGSRAGVYLYAIPLREVRELQIVDSMWAEICRGYSFKFVHGGFEWKFRDCVRQQAALNVIRKEAA